jgi:hypothetical protein
MKSWTIDLTVFVLVAIFSFGTGLVAGFRIGHRIPSLPLPWTDNGKTPQWIDQIPDYSPTIGESEK